MAQKTRIELIDDIDGSPADSTITFGVDGNSYVIDLSAKNAEGLRKALQPYIAAGRKSVRTRRTRRASYAPTGNAGVIREWAQGQGIEISARGRVSAEIREAYAKALEA